MSEKMFVRFCFFSVFFFVLSAGLHARSWKEIQDSGRLFVLTVDVERELSGGLHRIMMPIDREQILLNGFAKKHGLAIEYVEGTSFGDLFGMLESGQGDLISANLAATESRRKRFLLSEPFGFTREVVFTAADSGIKGDSWDSLAGRTGWLLPSTTYTENFRALSAGRKNITVRELPMTISHDDLIESVAAKKVDYSVLDECDLDAWMSYRSGIRKMFPVKDRVDLVFAANRDSTKLIELLNGYITQANASPRESVPQTAGKKESDIKKAVPKIALSGDLDAIRKRGYIRLLTSNDAFGCYLAKGRSCGFEYELAKRFGDSLGVAVVTVIPEDFKDLTRYLLEGKGDFIAANYTMDPERLKLYPGIAFCAPYFSVTQLLIGRLNENKVQSVSDLAGRSVFVRRGTAYVQTLTALQKKGIPVKIQYVPDDERPIITLRKVESGEYDLTVMDNTFFQLAVDGGCKIRNLLAVTEEQSFSWVVRKNNPKLNSAIRDFFKKENRGLFFNMCKKRYYSANNVKKLMPLLKNADQVVISPYDSLFKKYGAMYDFPWYFLAAQAYQESEFNPKRVNYIGAAGLMQVMPDTAKELKISNLTNPENGIHAGTKYMAMQRKYFMDSRIKFLDRLCFTLASYNAGYGHVADARRLAAQKGLNPNVWFDHTEKALALLEDPKYYSRTKCGYCRASETIPYVQNIILCTQRYMELMAVQKISGPAPNKH